MKGYIDVLQWYATDAKKLSDIADVEEHRGDAVSVDKLLGFEPPPITQEKPHCAKGHVVFQVEDDDSLTLVATNYDTSD